MYRRFTSQFESGEVSEADLAAKVGNIDEVVAAFSKDFDEYWAIDTELQKEGISALQNIADSYHLLQNLENVEAFYNTQKAQLGLTEEQLRVAEEIRDAIQKSYDPTAENLGLGENSKYYNATILDLIQEVQDYAEQIAALEAKQAAAQTAAQNQSSGGGSGSSGGGGRSGSSSGGIVSTGGTGRLDPLQDVNLSSGIGYLDPLKNISVGGGVVGYSTPNSTNTTNQSNTNSYKTLHNSSDININSMFINANSVEEFTASLRQKGLITNNTYGTR